MPRLLLVDDNPSIHKIAETLLATSDVELVSCGSGAQAMALVNQGDHFDVALLDTSMLGMDGWALLQQLRGTEATARMPVAMMAGVLDIVDPEKLRLAPIQGFLKKPVELRDLGDRIRRLMETPVPAPPPPVPEPAAEAAAFLTHPSLRVPDELRVPAVEEDDDVLMLGPEDLMELPSDELDAALPPPAEAAQALEALDIEEIPQALQETGDAAQLPPEPEPLDLEELDLEGLQNLTFPTSAMPALEEPAAPEAPEAAMDLSAPDSVPEFLLADTLPEPSPEPQLSLTDQLPDLGPALDLPLEPAPAPAPDSQLKLGDPIDWSDDSDSLVGMDLGGQEPSAFLPEEPAAAATPVAALPEIITLSDILDPPAAPFETGALPDPWLPTFEEFPTLAEVPSAPAAVVPPAAEVPPATAAELPPADGSGPDPLAALLADPVLMDRLAKALVARMGDQVLREIAWEVMPELADRLQQKAAP